MKVLRTLRRFSEQIDVVRLPQGWEIAVPRWMLDPVRCSQLPQEAKPRLAFSALLRLVEILDTDSLSAALTAASFGPSTSTKGQHVFKESCSLSSTPVEAGPEDSLGKVARSDPNWMPPSLDRTLTPSGAQQPSGKEKP